jgi:HEAT repeat protein
MNPFPREKPILSTTVMTVVLASLFLGCSSNILIPNTGNPTPSMKEMITKYQSQNWEIRQTAVKELRDHIKKSDSELLELAFIIASRDGHSSIRIEAIKGLEIMKTKKTIDRINELAVEDGNLNVRWQAISSLSKIHDPSSYTVFTQCFSSDDWLLREASIKGILSYSNSMPEDTITPFIEKGLKDENESVKISTLQNLQEKYETVYPLIRSIFKKYKKSSHPLLNASLKALKGYLLDRETREEMINLLGHKNSDIRVLAYRVLKQESILKSTVR